MDDQSDEPGRLSLYALVAVGTITAVASAASTPVVGGVVVGALAFGLAFTVTGEIPGEFYAVCAQVNPVFLVALVVEQRLADRLGQTETEAVREAQRARKAWPGNTDDKTSPGWEQAVADWTEQWPDHGWVWAMDSREVNKEARSKYRRMVLVQAVTILGAVFALALGEVTSILGVLSEGTNDGSPLFLLTISAFAASFTIIVLSALGELIRSVIPFRTWTQGC